MKVTCEQLEAIVREAVGKLDAIRNAPEDAATPAPVALGGEKGEAVAWRFRWHPKGDWHLTEKEPRGGDGTTKQPLFAAPVGKARMPPLELAEKFHEAYERLAPQFGYVTRAETRAFNPESTNGKTMIAVCAEILAGGTRSGG